MNNYLQKLMILSEEVVKFIKRISFQKLSQKDRFELYELLAVYVSDKADPEILFTKKRRSSKGPKNNIYRKVKLRMAEGISLAEALQPFIPPDEYIFLEAANGQRDFAVMLEELIRVTKAKNEAVAAFRNGAFMPLIIYFVAMTITWVAVFHVAPNIFKMAKVDNPQMSWVTDIMIPFLDVGFPFIVISIPLLFLIIIITMPHFSHKGPRKYLDKLFPWNVYKDMNSAIMILISSAAVKGGLTLEHIFRLQASISPKYMASWLELIRDRLSSGEYDSAAAMDVGIISDTDMDLIDDYSVSREFSDAIVKIGARALNNAKDRMKAKYLVFTFVFAMALLCAAVFIIGSVVGYLIVNADF
jgi:type II secretory pathway component PulF